MAQLRIMTGDLKGRKHEIDRDETTLGRAADNAIVVEDPAVSSRHCAVVRKGRVFTLRDLKSTNGTRLNGVSIKEHQLSPKDIISIGAVDILIDGEDVEPYQPPVSTASTGPQVTVRMANPTASGSRAAGFETKRDTRVFWIAGIGVVSVLILIALIWFLIRLFSSTSVPPPA